MDEELKNLLEEVKSYDKNADFELIKKTYEFTKKAHKGQKRHSGSDYFIHPLGVVHILLELRPDTTTICAALLHDVIEETDYTLEHIKKEFGTEIALLVEGETRYGATVQQLDLKGYFQKASFNIHPKVPIATQEARKGLAILLNH